MRRRSPNLKNETAERLNFRLNLTEQGQVVRWYIHELRFKLIFEKKSRLPVPTWRGGINEKAKKGQKKNRANKQKKKNGRSFTMYS